MISRTPWTIEDSAKIISADGDVVAEDYTFKNMDDFEAIPEAINNSRRGAEWAKSDSSNRFTSREGSEAREGLQDGGSVKPI